MKDLNFQLFVIVMQPVHTLQNSTESMNTFYSQRTYLERDDPNLIKKVAEYLIEVKNGSDDVSDNNDTNDTNITINANNAMFQYRAHNIVNVVNNDVHEAENDTNNA